MPEETAGLIEQALAQAAPQLVFLTPAERAGRWREAFGAAAARVPQPYWLYSGADQSPLVLGFPLRLSPMWEEFGRDLGRLIDAEIAYRRAMAQQAEVSKAALVDLRRLMVGRIAETLENAYLHDYGQRLPEVFLLVLTREVAERLRLATRALTAAAPELGARAIDEIRYATAQRVGDVAHRARTQPVERLRAGARPAAPGGGAGADGGLAGVRRTRPRRHRPVRRASPRHRSARGDGVPARAPAHRRRALPHDLPHQHGPDPGPPRARSRLRPGARGDRPRGARAPGRPPALQRRRARPAGDLAAPRNAAPVGGPPPPPRRRRPAIPALRGPQRAAGTGRRHRRSRAAHPDPAPGADRAALGHDTAVRLHVARRPLLGRAPLRPPLRPRRVHAAHRGAAAPRARHRGAGDAPDGALPRARRGDPRAPPLEVREVPRRCLLYTSP